MRFVQNKTYVRILPFLLMVIAVFTAFSLRAAEGAEAQAAVPSHYFTATYYHSSFRCPTCEQIEMLSAAAISGNFSNELKSGALTWRAVNIDEPANRHFSKDYQLYTQSLIISEMKDGKEVRWKNLEKVWTLVRNEKQFDQYVASEIKSWLGQ
jgi:hypothetical protein